MAFAGAITLMVMPPSTSLSYLPPDQFWVELQKLGIVILVVPLLVTFLAAIARTAFRTFAFRVINVQVATVIAPRAS